MRPADDDREAALRHLADRLFFKLERRPDGWRLVREADVSAPVELSALSLDQVEDTLNTWKLRGPHGG